MILSMRTKKLIVVGRIFNRLKVEYDDDLVSVNENLRPDGITGTVIVVN